MDTKTPRKTQIHVRLTPSTKHFTCIICGERKNNPKERQKIMKGSSKTELYVLIEKLLQINITEEGHSDICCRNCAGRLVTVEKSLAKFKDSYELTRAQLQRSHGHTSVKRMSKETGGQSKRKLKFAGAEETTTCHEENEVMKNSSRP